MKRRKKVSTTDKLMRTLSLVSMKIIDDKGHFEIHFVNRSLLLNVDDESESFCLKEIVFAPEGKSLSKEVFDKAVQMTQIYNNMIGGIWEEQTPLITLTYNISHISRLSVRKFFDILQSFIDAHTFIETNLFMLCDPDGMASRQYDFIKHLEKGKKIK